MIYIESPFEVEDGYNKKSIFLARGITGCPDWQANMVQLLNDLELIVFNPRRTNFPIHNPNAAREQIKWEFDYLAKSDIISFWFCKETMCPIVLYELGRWANSKKKIFIGMDPSYQRRQDVEIQTQLARPEIKIVYDLKDLSDQIKEVVVQFV